MAQAEQVLLTSAVLSDIPEELGTYHLVRVSAAHAEYTPETTDTPQTEDLSS